jgi:hypothetical protein
MVLFRNFEEVAPQWFRNAIQAILGIRFADLLDQKIFFPLEIGVSMGCEYYSSKSCICRYFGSGSPRRW